MRFHRRVARSSFRLLVAAAYLILTGCDGPALEPGTPLLTALHPREVLVESPRLTAPPDEGPNRFLAGWFPWRHEGRRVFGGAPAGARLEIVQLAQRQRTLHLDLVVPPAAGAQVEVLAAGAEVGVFPLTDPMEIPLPADLPLGRVPIELRTTGGPLDLVAAGLRPVLPAGEARLAGGDLIQRGESTVELARWIEPERELAGTFLPPADPAPGQSFAITVEDATGATLGRFEADLRAGRSQPFRLPLAAPSGLVRITLTARGFGPPARWQDLRWVGGETPPSSPAARESEPAPPSDSPPAPPRIVLVYVMDALRADFVGHLGLDHPGGVMGLTPAWDRLAAEGVTFRNHRSVAPSTLPSTRALFTGRALSGPSADAPALHLRYLAEIFRDAGYRTGLFSGNAYVGSAYGLDRGFDHVAEEVLFDEDSLASGPGYNDNAARVQAAALDWLDTLGPDRRAFLYLHVIHPHNPYHPPPEIETRLTRGIRSKIDGASDTLLAIRDQKREITSADRRRLTALYAGGLAYADRELAGLIEALTSRFGAESLFVAVTADHGEELFEHGGVLHGYTLYEEQLRIPLVLWSPGRIAPGVRTDATSSLDLHATLAELATGSDSAEIRGEGHSLLGPRVAAEAGSAPELHFAAAPNVREGLVSVEAEIEGRLWKLVLAARHETRWGMGLGLGRTWDPEYLFDLCDDPGEKENLVGRGGLVEPWLRSRLLDWLEGRELDEEQPEVDRETRERLRALGYAG